MHNSYLALNLVFIGLAAGLVAWLRLKLPGRRQLGLLSAILAPAMLIFDGYLTWLPIVTYNTRTLLGLHIGTIPVEDFAYLVVVLVLAPALFNHFAAANKRNDHAED